MSPDQQKLAAWLRERKLDQQLGGDEAEYRQNAPFPYEMRKQPEGAFAAGDIAILRPSPSAMSHGPVYGLMLESAGFDSWLMIPFSRYPHPATPGEWATQHTSVLLRVLCFWNARTVFSSACLPGRAAHLDTEMLAAVSVAYSSFMRASGKTSQPERFGPPLIHPADPRYEYLDEERDRIDAHLGTLYSDQAGQQPRKAWLLAAEGRPGYGTREK